MAASSAATAVMALDAWLAGEAPAHYVRRTSRAMRERLAEAAGEVERSSAPNAARRSIGPARRASEALARADAAISASDHAAVEQSRSAVAAAGSSFGGPKRSGQPQ